MNDKHDGGGAFPKLHSGDYKEKEIGFYSSSGMSLRDYFAAKAMASMLTGCLTNDRMFSCLDSLMKDKQCKDETLIAKWAYEYADAMLKEKDR